MRNYIRALFDPSYVYEYEIQEADEMPEPYYNVHLLEEDENGYLIESDFYLYQYNMDALFKLQEWLKNGENHHGYIVNSAVDENVEGTIFDMLKVAREES